MAVDAVDDSIDEDGRLIWTGVQLEREANLGADRVRERRDLAVVEALERGLGAVGVVTSGVLVGKVARLPRVFEGGTQRLVPRRRKTGRDRVAPLACVDLERLMDDVSELEVAGRVLDRNAVDALEGVLQRAFRVGAELRVREAGRQRRDLKQRLARGCMVRDDVECQRI